MPEFAIVGGLDNTDYLAADITVLFRCTWSGGAKRKVTVSSTREPRQGRIFYSNFAKQAVDLEGPLAEQHLFPGIGWALRF